MRLVILGDKIIGGNSAYSKIGLELCNRLTEAGHKVAHIPMGFANRMGIQSLDNGVRIYESGNSPFSEDVVEEHYAHFKADLLISLKETWCVPPETLVETSIGSMPIKDFIEKHWWKWLQVNSLDGFVNVLDTQKYLYADNLIEIETGSGKKVRVTKDNLIYVVNRGWVRPSEINIGDGVIITLGGYHFDEVDTRTIGTASQAVYSQNTFEGSSTKSWASTKICCKQSFRSRSEEELLLFREKLESGRRRIDKENISNILPRRNATGSTESIMVCNRSTGAPIRNTTIRNRNSAREICENDKRAAEHGGNRQGVSGRNNRRRRLHRDIQIPLSKDRQRVLCYVLQHIKHLKRIDGLVRKHGFQKTINSSQINSEKKQFGKDSMLQVYNWNQKSMSFDESDFTISDHQEKEGRINDQVCRDKNGKASEIPIWGRRVEHLQSNCGTKEKVTSIKQVPYNGLVYDLTTESGNFFANGILIHNCFNLLPQLPINYVPHCIIDHEPLSPLITYGLGTTYRNIAITRFGQRMLKNAGFSSTYIPHGINCDIFKPIPEHKKECRKLWFLDEDAFVIGIVARNQARKQIGRMLRGFKRFQELNPTVKTQLIMWTNIRPPAQPEDTPMGVGDVSVDLLPEMVELGIIPHTVIPDARLIRHGVPDWSGDDYKSGWDMVKLYGTMDVLLNCTGGEGFGMPLIEAQAAGIPVITTDYAGGPEQVGAGLVVPYSDYVIVNTPGTKYALCDIEKMAEALTKIYNADREKLAKKARAFALRYDWPRVMEYWESFLSECEPELHPLITKEGVKTWN